MKKILIFGRSGQILGDIYNLLAHNPNFNLLSVARSGSIPDICTCIQLSDYSLERVSAIISFYQPDFVIYALAAGSVRARKDNLETITYINITLPVHIAHELSAMDKQSSLIAFGSFAEYSGYKSDIVVDKNLTPLPISDYAISKVRSSELLWNLHDSYPHFCYQHLTLASVFGGLEHPSRLIPQILLSFRNNLIVSISSNYSKRDYLYSLDISILLENLLLNYSVPSRVICATSASFSNFEVFEILFKLFYPSQVIRNDMFMLLERATTPSLIGDSTQFECLLGHMPVRLSDCTLEMVLPSR